MSRSLTISYNGITNRIKCEAFVSKPGDLQKVKLNALWDTGATQCVISERYAQSIGLMKVGVASMNHAGGTDDVNVYVADIELLNKVVVRDVKLLSTKSINDFDMIIGMDVITLGDFCVTNKDKKTVVSFRYPSESCIDFVKDSEDMKIKRLKALGRNAKCPCGSGKKIKECCGKGLV